MAVLCDNAFLRGISAASSGGHVIEGSGLFDGSTGEFSWTPSAGDSNQIYTIEVLLKHVVVPTTSHQLFSAGTNSSNYTSISFTTAGAFEFAHLEGGAILDQVTTNALFRDFSSFQQIVVAVDKTQATASDRIRIYINGTEITSFATNTREAAGGDTFIGKNTTHYISEYPGGSRNSPDYFARVTYIDGTQLDATSFGETDDNGGWRILDVSGLTYGTNGVRFQAGDIATGFNSNGDGTDEKSASGDWTGTNIANFSFADGKITMGTTNDQSIYSTQTFAGDFEIEFIPNNGTTDTVSFGVVESAELANIDQSHAFAHSASITDGTYFMLIADKCYIRSASSLVDDASGGFSWSAGDKIKLKRSSGTITVYKNGSLAHTFSQTNSNTMMMLRGGGNQSGVGYVTSEVQWNDGGSLSLNGFKTGTITATNDSPTDSTDGSGTYGNYANFNDEYQIGSTAYNNATYSQGGTHATYANGEGSVLSQAVALGNGIYFEATLTTPFGSTYYDTVGFIDPTRYASTIANIQESAATGYSFFKSNGQKSDDGATLASYGSAWDTAGKVIGVYISPTGKVWYTIDGTLQNSATESEVVNDTGTSHAFTLSGFGQILPVLSARGSNTVWDLNCGQFAWNTTPYSGYAGLSTANTPAPTVTTPSTAFNTVLYTGTGATKSVTGVGFQPDLVWIKNRTGVAASHHLYDVLRGANAFLRSNTADAENTASSDVLTSFDSDGFSLGADVSNEAVNKSGDTYVAWCLKAGGAGSSNTDGSITSTVSVAAHGGFSIGTYTGTGTAGTVGHGLGSDRKSVV